MSYYYHQLTGLPSPGPESVILAAGHLAFPGSHFPICKVEMGGQAASGPKQGPGMTLPSLLPHLPLECFSDLYVTHHLLTVVEGGAGRDLCQSVDGVPRGQDSGRVGGGGGTREATPESTALRPLKVWKGSVFLRMFWRVIVQCTYIHT